MPVEELRHEVAEIVCDRRFWRIVFVAQDANHFLKGAVLLDELPHSRADRIESEVDSGCQIEDDGLAVEIAKHDILADRHDCRQPSVRHWLIT